MSRWVCFNHGKESGPWGAKILRLAGVAEELGYGVISPDYRGMDSVEARAETLLEALPSSYSELVLVGSSMGAYVALMASRRCAPDALFLLAPALGLPGFPVVDLEPRAGRVMLVHGWSDEVVPVDNVLRYSRRYSLPLCVVDSDHRLMSALDFICQQFRLFLQAGVESAAE